MKKNLCVTRRCQKNPHLRKILMTMKLMTVMFFLAISNLMATEAYSQNARLTLHLEDATVKEVLSKIEDNSEFFFLYNGKLVDVNRKVSVDATDEKISGILSDLFRKTDVCWSVIDRQIVLTDKANQSSFANIGSQQQQKITGSVTDEKGNPLPGVTILVKGTTIGALTDVSGKYIINNPPQNATLTFSFVGMATQEIPSNGQMLIDVVLKESAIGLDEVVVVGYGTQKKRNVTGSIASVKGVDLNKSTITNFTQNLQGNVPGLTALQSSGQPGAGPDVQIRSNPSFASSGVLYILDGVPVNDNAGEPGFGLSDSPFGNGGVDRSSLNFINPNDIESIEVLKDAAAASIYGARAGAGVILITTKHGKSGKPKIEYSGSYAFQEPAKFYDILGTTDFMTERNHILMDMWMRDNNISPYGNTDPSTVSPFVPKYTDAQISNTPQQESAIKAITRNGFINQHNLSLSGGNSDTRYFVSGNYLTQQGVILGSDYTRYNGRFNLDQVVTKHIKIGIQLSTSNSNADNASVGKEQWEKSGVIESSLIYPANLPLINSDGTYPLNPDYVNAPNPLSFHEVTDKTASARLLTNGYVEWTIIPDLKAKASFSYDQSSSKRSFYYPKSFLPGTRANGQAAIHQQSNASNLFEYTLNYVHKFGKNQSVNFLGGYSYQLSNWEGLSAGNYNFITDNFLYNNLSSGAAPRPTVESSKSNQIWASYFARTIYELKDKYLLTATIRRDGSSIFAVNKKYGIFPSVSAGWIISEEPFLKGNISFINFLKLRASYGTTGNSNIGGNAFAYYSTGARNWDFNNTPNIGVYMSQLNNDNLTWETAREVNIGIDYQILENRITGSFDYFNRTISNLLTYRPLPTSFPVSSIADNIGKTRSRGWELGIQTKNIVSANDGGFEWNTEFTLSYYKNSWIERSPEELKILPKYIDPKGLFNGIYGYQSDGIYTGKTPPPAWMPGILPGTVIIKDLNGYDANGNLTGEPDGKISSADNVLLANGDPKLSFGIKNTFRYKNFDLSIYMYGITGMKYNTDYQNGFDVEHQLAGYGMNIMSIAKDRWSYDNQDSKFPSGLLNAYTDYATNSDFWLEKVNFLRCRDITLGYTLPSNIIKKQNMVSGLRVNLSVQNAFIITNYRGIDPELSSFISYPNPRSVVFGLNASF